MMKKIKGQGALEYLLLIGGAVLIAVIVIALLVGMGGQSRNTATDQANKAQQAMNVVEASQITSISLAATPTCTDAGVVANFNMVWQPVTLGGTKTLMVVTNAGVALTVTNPATGTLTDTTLSYSGASPVTVTKLGTQNCRDTYWAFIRTVKDGVTVDSARTKFSFLN